MFLDKMMQIRCALKKDLKSIQKVIKAAFSEEETKTISNLVADLSTENILPAIKPLVADIDHEVVGYICYSPVFFESAGSISGYILTPLGVAKDYQRQGVGSGLIRAGINSLSNDGVDVLLVHGDPEFYGRLGFEAEIARFFVPPYPLEHPFGWLGMVLAGSAMPETPCKVAGVSALNKPNLW